MPRNARAIADEIEETWNRAEREGRELTAAERNHMEGLIEAAKSQHSLEQQIKSMDPGGPLLGRMTGEGGAPAYGGGPGDVFIASKGYQAIKDADHRPQRYSSGPIEVSQTPLSMKGTLLETGVSGPGGGLVPPSYAPGVVEKLFEPLGVADVFGSSTTSGSQIRYVVEGTATNAAAGVAEAGTKPESTIAMSEVVEPIKKIATVLPISDELLEDAPSIQSYLNGRLGLFVKLEEERQLLRGAGTNELVGIFGRAGINQYTRLAADDNAVALAKVIANTAGSSFLAPDTVIIHPTNWLTRGCSGTARAARSGSSTAAARSPAPTATPAHRACSASSSGTPGWCCRPTSARARRWSATSARPPTCGAGAACPWRPRTAIATGFRRTCRCSGPRSGSGSGCTARSRSRRSGA
jgi:HK97 family phage major capsid protein